MKEITYEYWQKNPTPRMMWCWDDCEKVIVKRKVVYFSKENIVDYPVIVLLSDDTCLDRFQHCAEIEEPKTEKLETKSSKGFYVYNRSGSKPSYIHETLEAAKEEAERIFNLNHKSNIKEPLEVLEIVARYTPKVTAEWE